ncbi:hypothetical protein HDU76_006869 [Blyttiomyces sp. JEL0837]|nr:hypothetical protein HDU76_006869 [Blyttiomyces sp. JEL0837]
MSPITLGNLPVEVLDEIAYRLHPRFVHRLSLTSRTFFNRYSYPIYSFAKKNLEWNPDTILDVIVEAISNDDDEEYDDDEASTQLKTVLHQDMFFLGDHYLAASISTLGLKDSLNLYLGFDISTFNLDTWFRDFTSSKVQSFCKLLSIVATAGDLDLSQENFLVVYFLTAVGDLDTFVILQSKEVIPSDCYQQILTHGIQRNHNNLATWILSLNVINPSVMENKAFMAAVEFGNVIMIETLLQDIRVHSTIDWNAVMVTAIDLGHGDNDELLQYIHNKEKTNLWTILPNLELDCLSPFRHAFELLTQDWNDKQLSHNWEDNCRLFEVSIAAGSLRMVANMQRLLDWDGQQVPHLRSCFDLAVLHRHWDIIEYFIQQKHLFNPYAYVSCLKDAVVVKHIDMVKFVVDSCVQDGYTNVWKVVETDVLPAAAKFGFVEIINYVLTLDQVDISSNCNTALINAVMSNQPSVVEGLLKSGRLVDTPLPRFGFTHNDTNTRRFWGSHMTRSCLGTLFHEACYLRFYHIVRIFVECKDQIGLDFSDGFAFRMAASFQELDYQNENDDSENDSDGESVDGDASDDASDLSSLTDDLSHMDWSKTDDTSESTRYTNEGDRFALCELLLQTGNALPIDLTHDILKAASSLPFYLFKKIMEQGQYTKQDISDLLLTKYDNLKIPIQANQMEVFEYLWAAQEDSFDYEFLYSGLYFAVSYNRQRFGALIVKSIHPIMEEYRGSSTAWFQLLVDMLGNDWDLDLVLGTWVKMSDDVKKRFYEYVVVNELFNVLDAMKVRGVDLQ